MTTYTNRTDLLFERLDLFIATADYRELTESEKKTALIQWINSEMNNARKAEYLDRCLAKAMPRWIANYYKRYEC